MKVIDNTVSKFKTGILVRSNQIGTIAIINGYTCFGTFAITILKTGRGSSGFVGQLITDANLNGWSVLNNSSLTINGEY